MYKTILRENVESLIRDIASKDEKIVVTGLDASGKTTILSKVMPEYPIFKFDENLSEVYLDPRYPDSKYVCDYWKIYDRHPYIDYFIYDSVNRNNIQGIIDEYINKYISEILEINNFIVFMNDKYIGIKPHEGLVHDKRSDIIAAFRYYMDKLKDKVNFYVVED